MASGGKMDRRRRHLLANAVTLAPLGGSGENLSLGDIKQNTHIAIFVKKTSTCGWHTSVRNSIFYSSRAYTTDAIAPVNLLCENRRNIHIMSNFNI